MLLVGDETATPAICSILESLDPRCEVDAFIEVPTRDDVLAPAVSDRARVRWLARCDAEHGAVLIDAVTAWTAENADLLTLASAPRPQQLEDIDVDHELLWDSPDDGEGEFYAWMAGEAATRCLSWRGFGRADSEITDNVKRSSGDGGCAASDSAAAA